jgi:orotate phosphoribosyltransferase
MTNEKAVAEKLLQINAIKLNSAQPFTWASGWKSPIYCDNRKILSFPHEREFIKSEMSNLIFDKFADAELVAGVATAGIAWGALVADQLKLPFVYVRPKPKEHGLGNQIEGFFEPGQKTIVVEDLVSTGKSSLEVVKVLQQAGLRIDGLVSIFSYGFPVADEVFKDAGVTKYALTNYPVLVALALEKGLVAANELATLEEWGQQPATWKQ